MHGCIFGWQSIAPFLGHCDLDPYFVEIDHEIISRGIQLTSADSRRAVVRELMVNRKLQTKSVVRCTDRLDMTMAVDCKVKHQTIQTNCDLDL